MDKPNNPRKKSFSGSKTSNKKYPKSKKFNTQSNTDNYNPQKGKKKNITNENNFGNHYESEMYNKEKPRKPFSFNNTDTSEYKKNDNQASFNKKNDGSSSYKKNYRPNNNKREDENKPRFGNYKGNRYSKQEGEGNSENKPRFGNYKGNRYNKQEGEGNSENKPRFGNYKGNRYNKQEGEGNTENKPRFGNYKGNRYNKQEGEGNTENKPRFGNYKGNRYNKQEGEAGNEGEKPTFRRNFNKSDDPKKRNFNNYSKDRNNTFEHKKEGFKPSNDGGENPQKPHYKPRGDFKKNNYSKEKPNKFISEDLFSDDFSYGDNSNDKRDFLKKRQEDKKARSFDNVRNNQTSYPKKKGGRFQEKSAEETDLIRLNKFIADSGICSRREADELIENGEISVNQEIVTELGTKINLSKDIVKYKGKILKREKFIYLLLNKPKDFITTTDDEDGRKTVMDLVSNACEERIYPVGRLDRNTTGLLLLTNDGELAEKLTHPSFETKKVYQVALNKPLTAADFNKLVEGFELEDGFIKADDIAIITPDNTVVGLEIHSGKNRVVRRMFEHLGYDVEMLDRTMFAGLNKKNLSRGKWRMLTTQEINRIKYMM